MSNKGIEELEGWRVWIEDMLPTTFQHIQQVQEMRDRCDDIIKAELEVSNEGD